MFKKLIISLFLIFIFSVESIFAKVIEQDSLALVALYDSTDGDNWNRNDNWNDGPVDTWYRVTVTGNRVTGLQLGGNNLVGSIPSSIGDLDSLVHLHLQNNDITGSIPSEIGSLSSLTELYLYNNELTGSIPSEIENLTNLEVLYISNNQLTGTIPSTIENLINLEYLNLNNNQLTDSIPSGIEDLPTLWSLLVDNNDLEDLPDLSGSSSLLELNVRNNKLTFEDIEPNIGISTFRYSPQDSVGELQNDTVSIGSNLTISVSVGGDNNQYQWENDAITIPSATDSFYTISNAKIGDAGSYTCEITNTVATNLTLYSRPINVTVIDTTSPLVVATNPIQNGMNISKNTNISVAFDVDMNESTINDSTFIVHSLQKGLHSGTYSYDGGTNTGTFNPDNDFPVGDIVTVILTTAIEDLSSEILDIPFEWSFTIEADGGSGEFAAKADYGTAYSPYSVFSSDLDGDGDMDLAAANHFSDNVSVLLNNGNGTFATKVDYSTGDGSYSVFSSDLDGDGDMDLAVANEYSDNVSVLLNNGNGTFASRVNYDTEGDWPRSVFSSDLDGDGDMDLTVANESSENISIFWNNGDGTFIVEIMENSTNFDGPHSIFSSDLDSDGDMDLAVVDRDIEKICVLLNKGDGTFANKVDYDAGDSPRSVFSSDLDGDGDMDLAVANWFSRDVSVLLNNGDGTFAGKVDYDLGSGSNSVFSSDLDGDGDMDLAAVRTGAYRVSVLLNNGNGTFTPKVDYDVNSDPFSVFSSDLDGDGHMDLAVANSSYDDNISVLLNNNPPYLTITSPNGGETWLVGNTYSISWTANGTSEVLNIEYSTDNGSNWIGIADSTEDNNYYHWTIPNTPSDSCLVRISDIYGNPCDTSDAMFEISSNSAVPTPELPKVYSMSVKGATMGNSIEFEYTIPEEANVRFIMYDINGKIVKEFSEEKKPGFYSGKIDARNNSAGVYFIRMKANGKKFTQTNKVLLIK